MSTLIRRNPIAREELHRITVRAERATCTWCGGASMKGRVRRLFGYVTVYDGGRRAEHSGLFCSIGCFDAYYS